MLEVEMKFAVADPAQILAKLVARGACEFGLDEHADTYLKAPDRDFVQTDEALRVRQMGSVNLITYKGPKLGGPAKVRTELEVGLAPGVETAEEFLQLMEMLGYRRVATVRKTRRILDMPWQHFDVQIGIDEVDRVGKFVELEILVAAEQRAEAEAALVALAAEMGLTQPERRSYLGMWLSVQEPAPS